MKFEAWLKRIHAASEKAWKDERKESVSSLHNKLVKVIVDEEAHIDDIIIAVEVLRQGMLRAKMEEIEEGRSE